MTEDGYTTAGDYLRLLESFDRLFNKTEISKMACHGCGAMFWDDEVDYERQPHGELTQVCPTCGSDDFSEATDE